MENKSFKKIYHLPTDKEEFVNNFLYYNFSNSSIYKRATAYFSSQSLMEMSFGIEKFYCNKNAKIQYIFSHKISEKEFLEMREGYLERYNSDLINQWRKNLELIDKSQLSKISYLIKIGLVDIKICYTTNQKGIFHSKFGIFKNLDNFNIAFAGSNNETYMAINENVETVYIFNDTENKDVILEMETTFDQWWNNNSQNSIVVELPQTIYKEIDSFSHHGELFFNNSILLDITDSNFLVLKNNNNVNLDSYLYDSKIKRIVLKENHDLIFNNVTLIDDIEKYINIIKEICLEKKILIFEDIKLLQYLKDRKIELNKRFELGQMLKEGLLWDEKYIKFCEIIKKNFIRRPYDLQLQDMYFMTIMMRSANFSVPGTGKTTIVYGAFTYLKEIKTVNKLLVISPLNAFKSWENEFQLNFGIKPKILKWEALSKYKNEVKFLNYSNDCDIILLNFENLANSFDALKGILDSKTMLVIDEYHRIKNPNGVRAKLVKDISGFTRYRVCLSGTPMPNGFQDIYNLLLILFKEETQIFANFLDINKLKKLTVDEQKKFKEIFYPFFIRTNKAMLQIPPPEPDIKYVCSATSSEIKLLQFVANNYKNPLTRLIRICQASTSPKSLYKNLNRDEIKQIFCEATSTDYENVVNIKINDLDYKAIDVNKEIEQIISDIHISSKIKKAIQITENIVKENRQLITWSTFISTINEYEKELEKNGIPFRKIIGDTKEELRDEIINDFKNKKFQVLITNPQTLAESISLHQNCHDALYIDYSYNLVHLLQSKDRIHRLGLNVGTKTNYHFVVLNISNNSEINDFDTILRTSYDAHILKRLNEKEKIMNDLINKDEFYTLNNINLTTDEIEDLFKTIKL